jgi:antitoxin component of MazEF toxin-antitoxin module
MGDDDYTRYNLWIYERLSISFGYTLIRSFDMQLTIPVKVVKIGNSLRMTIPKPVATALEIQAGDVLEVGLAGWSMTVKRRGAKEKVDTIFGVEKRKRR